MRMRLVTYISVLLLSLFVEVPTAFAESAVQIQPDCSRLDCDDPGVEYVLEILEVAGDSVDDLLDSQIDILVYLTEGARFDYQYRYDQQYKNLITIGDRFIDSMYQGAQDDEITFEALLEWAFYHEVGHAVLTHLEANDNFSVDDSSHELFADIFATVHLLDELKTSDAEEAAFGMLGLVVPSAGDKISAYATRKGFSQDRQRQAQRGERYKLASAAGQMMGPHQPTEYRVDNILCLADMKDAFDLSGEIPQPETGCDQNLDEMVKAILEAFYN